MVSIFSKKNGKAIELKEIYGTSIIKGKYLTSFNKDGTYEETLDGSLLGDDKGNYTISGNKINIVTINGTKKVLKFNEKTGYITTEEDEGIIITLKKEESKNEVEEKTTENTVKGEKLIQFENEFFELEKIALEYREFGKIKNYKDFNYDLDGDGVKDKITIRRKKGIESSVGEEYVYVFELNGKEFIDDGYEGAIYIVDLNKNDKNLEVILFDQGPSDDPGYMIFTKKGNKMVLADSFERGPLKADKKGDFVVGDWLQGSIEPGIYFNYYYIKDGKIQSKQTDVSKIKNVECKSPYMYFTKDLKNLTKFERELEIRDEKYLNNYSIEELKNTKFKIISYKESTKKEWENESIPYKLYVQLSDGRKGYVFHIQWAG